ncbi:MAG: hypothetical protein ACRD2P_13770 [Terriglobia bacterium]
MKIVLVLLILALPGVAGASMACNGSAPYYCAPTDKAIRLIDPMAPPPVGAPFVFPGSGEVGIRLTGPNTMKGFNNGLNAEFFGMSADTVPQWSNYDSLACSGAGGYRVFVQGNGGFGSGGSISGTIIPFEVCPGANTMVKVAGIGSSGLANTGYLNMTNPSFSFGDPAVMYYTSGSSLYSYCYPDASLSDPKCSNGRDASTLVYNFASCPNLPTAVPTGDQVGTYTDITGRYVEAAFAVSQNTYGLIFRYDTQTGNCLWFSPATFDYGGTGLTTSKANGGPLGDPTAPEGLLGAPTLTANYGSGTIPAGTYYVKWTGNGQVSGGGALGNQWNLNGQSAGSNEASITLTATGSIQIKPAQCFSGTSMWCNVGDVDPYWMAYVGASPGGETLQNSILLSPVANGSATTFTGNLTTDLSAFKGQIVVVTGNQVLYDSGSGLLCTLNVSNGSYSCPGSIVYTPGGAVSAVFPTAPPNGAKVYLEWWFHYGTQETISSLSANGPTSPTVSTAGTGLHYANMNAGGNYFYFAGEGTSGNSNSLYWQIGTPNTSFGSNYNGTTGHVAPGFNTQISVACMGGGTVPCTADLDMAPMSNPENYTKLMLPPPLPGFEASAWAGNTQHISWTADNSSDTYPFLNGYSPTGGWVQPASPLQFELFATNPSYPATAYRFAHTRSSGLFYMGGPNDFYHFSFGGEDPSGHWADFSTTWNNSLGFLVAPWAPGTNYSQGWEYTDSNNNLEVETAASCTSGTSVPTWLTTMGAKLSGDGTCSWIVLGLYGVPFAGPVWNSNVYYQAGAYVVDAAGNLQKETVSFCASGGSVPSWTTTTTADNTCNWGYVEATGLSGPPGAVDTRVDVFAIRTQ